MAKALRVFEVLDFQRGGNPRSSLGIGLEAQYNKILKENPHYIISNKNPLWVSAKAGNPELVRFFIERGEDPTANDSAALRWASGFGHEEVVKILLQAGADPLAKNSEAFSWAERDGHEGVLRILSAHINKVPLDENVKFTRGGDEREKIGIGNTFERKMARHEEFKNWWYSHKEDYDEIVEECWFKGEYGANPVDEDAERKVLFGYTAEMLDHGKIPKDEKHREEIQDIYEELVLEIAQSEWWPPIIAKRDDDFDAYYEDGLSEEEETKIENVILEEMGRIDFYQKLVSYLIFKWAEETGN